MKIRNPPVQVYRNSYYMTQVIKVNILSTVIVAYHILPESMFTVSVTLAGEVPLSFLGLADTGLVSRNAKTSIIVLNHCVTILDIHSLQFTRVLNDFTIINGLKTFSFLITKLTFNVTRSAPSRLGYEIPTISLAIVAHLRHTSVILGPTNCTSC